MKRKLFFIMFTIMILATVQSQDNKNPNIKIGFSGPLSGELERFGVYQIEAIESVIKKYKNIFDIELIKLDDQCHPELAYKNAIQLSEENVDFVIGHTCSGATIQALPVYLENNIVCITTAATNPNINTDQKYINFFRTIPNDKEQSKKLIEFAEKQDLRNVIVVYEINEYGMTIANGIKDHNTKLDINYIGLDVQENRFYQEKENTEDLSMFIKKTDLIIYCGYYIEFRQTYNFFKDYFGYNKKYLGCEGVYDERLFDEKILIFDNVYVITSEYLNNIGIISEIIEDYIAKNGEEPGPYYERTYNTVDMLLNIYNKRPELLNLENLERSKELINILRNEKFETYLGNVKFKENGDIIDETYQYFVVNNGTFLEYRN